MAHFGLNEWCSLPFSEIPSGFDRLTASASAICKGEGASRDVLSVFEMAVGAIGFGSVGSLTYIDGK